MVKVRKNFNKEKKKINKNIKDIKENKKQIRWKLIAIKENLERLSIVQDNLTKDLESFNNKFKDSIKLKRKKIYRKKI